MAAEPNTFQMVCSGFRIGKLQFCNNALDGFSFGVAWRERIRPVLGVGLVFFSQSPRQLFRSVPELTVSARVLELARSLRIDLSDVVELICDHLGVLFWYKCSSPGKRTIDIRLKSICSECIDSR